MADTNALGNGRTSLEWTDDDSPALFAECPSLADALMLISYAEMSAADAIAAFLSASDPTAFLIEQR